MQIWEVTKEAVKASKCLKSYPTWEYELAIIPHRVQYSYALFYSLYTYTTVNPTDNLDMFIKKKYRLGKTLKSLYMYAK